MQNQLNQAGKLCACGNEIKTGRDKCNTCRNREWRKANPEKAIFNDLRFNAKRRRVGFFLTFDEFLAWLRENIIYMTHKGKTADSLSIDRKRAELGYRAGNLQVLTISQNIKKYKAGESWPSEPQSKEDAGTPF